MGQELGLRDIDFHLGSSVTWASDSGPRGISGQCADTIHPQPSPTWGVSQSETLGLEFDSF